MGTTPPPPTMENRPLLKTPPYKNNLGDEMGGGVFQT